jgi:hypothetical protein
MAGKPMGRTNKGKRGIGSGSKSEQTSSSKPASKGGDFKNVKHH